jgi:hypothetical protein
LQPGAVMKILALIIAGAGLLCGVFALALQFSITIPESMATGRSLFLSVLFYFSFFTILANCGAAICHTAQILPFKFLEILRHRSVGGAATTAMVMVAMVYNLILAPEGAPQGESVLCDMILHYVTPALMVAWWLASANGRATFQSIVWWLVPPAVYLAFVYVRWHFVHEVSNPFLDPALGQYRLLSGIFGIVILFVSTGLVVILLDKAVGQITRRQDRYRNSARYASRRRLR